MNTALLVPASADPAAPSSAGPRHWLFLVHQLPSGSSNLRVRTWRRLQQLGAISVKQAVYLLPDSPGAREDLQALTRQIDRAGGTASVFSGHSLDARSEDQIIHEFRRLRDRAYSGLARDVAKALRHRGGRRSHKTRAPSARQRLDALRQRLGSVERLDFFGAAGRERVVALLDRLSARVSGREPAAAPPPARRLETYRGRVWVTRPRPGVDRMASAWLIRRFIDREARFAFVPDPGAVAADAVPFDMSGVEFSHEDGQCTFETLCRRFDIGDEGVRRLTAIVHDLDLKDGRYGAAEASTIGAVVEGLQLAHAADGALLEHGIALFEALYRSRRRHP